MADKKKTSAGGSRRRLLIAAALMGQHGGKKGGPARAAKLSAERRSEISKMGALAAKRAKAKKAENE